jgi:FAD/FMN-containing dehydrogenase
VTHPLLQILRGRIGATQVLTEGDLSAWELDWRRRWRGRALAVVRPGSTDEVADVLRACAAHGVTVVPQGGNTGLVGGGVPDDSGTQVLLSLSRLNRVRRIDTANLTITAEAGCVLQALQAKVEEAGLLFPLSMASQGSCTIGGNLATNAGGTQVLRYGNARELCLGLEVVNAAGEVWDGLSGLRKDNTGYDLRDLFIGSEGTLGVITAATLKLYPRPAAALTALATCDRLEQCAALLSRAHGLLGAGLTGFEVMNRFSLELVRRHFPALPQPLPPAAWTVLIEHADHESEAHARDRFEALLADALEAGVIGDAAVAESLSQAQALWHVRESIPLAQSEEGLNIKHDISLPVSAIAAFASEADVQLQSRWPGIRLVNFGHLGDGNLHYNVQAPVGVDPALFLQTHEADVNHVVYDLVQLHDGSISAEHGVGVLKRDELVQRKPAAAMAMMRAIKQALDPSGLLNPGRVL